MPDIWKSRPVKGDVGIVFVQESDDFNSVQSSARRRRPVAAGAAAAAAQRRRAPTPNPHKGLTRLSSIRISRPIS